MLRNLIQSSRTEGAIEKIASRNTDFGLVVTLEKTGLRRKPFRFRMEGKFEFDRSLSVVRASILLVGLLDYQDRLEGGDGSSDIFSAYVSALKVLENEETDELKLYERIRIALYRFKMELGSTSAPFSGFPFSLDGESLRFELKSDQPSFPLAILWKDHRYSEIIEKIIPTSLLDRVRKSRALHIPNGPRGLDRALLELYQHDFDLQIRAAYFRPASLCWPRVFLERANSSAAVFRRYDLALEGMKSGKVEILDVLPESALWDLCQMNQDGFSDLYPFPASRKEVQLHLDHLIFRMQRLPGYSLCLTRSELPMYVIIYQIMQEAGPEFFTICCRRDASKKPDSNFLGDVESYFIHDRVVAELLGSYAIDHVLQLPGTETNQEKVIERLKIIRDSLN